MRYRHRPRFTRVTALTLAASAALAAPAGATTFDFDRGNAAIEVVIPNVVASIFARVKPGDASLVLRATTLITNAMFDAIAPYHPSAVGVYSRLGRRPASEGLSERQRNIALLYASLEVLNSLYPSERAKWQGLLSGVGLDPNLASDDLQTAAGIGRAAGMAVVAVRERDGMNQLGDARGKGVLRLPYADTTGYRPVNSAYELADPSRWQPAITSGGNGIFTVQQFVTPQWGTTLPYSYRDVERFTVPPPLDSHPHSAGYKKQVDEILAASAALTDPHKLAAELFNNKIASLGFVALFLAQSQRWSVEQFVHYDFLVNMAAFDGGIATWNQKIRYDAVRPFSAVRHVYRNGLVSAWGGPGKGTVQVPANRWRSYLNVADHPDYPSGSSCFCAAHAQASRRWLGSDALGWVVPYAKGSSLVEPGVTPAADTALSFETWTKFEQVCGQSRLWGGVHFQAAIDQARPMCRRIGDGAVRFLRRHVDGDVDVAQDARE